MEVLTEKQKQMSKNSNLKQEDEISKNLKIIEKPKGSRKQKSVTNSQQQNDQIEDENHKVKMLTTFDPLTHKPPRIDQKGYNKETHKGKELLNRASNNILNEQVSIPKWWDNHQLTDYNVLRSKLDSSLLKELTDKNTRSKLIENRHKSKLPDLSYDIDQDGFVGGRDYVISRMFDKDQKNYLNDEEKKELQNALQNGFESQFMWNIEKSGNSRPYRILQKRGVIVDADNFLPVGETYPQHPINLVKPKIGTLSDLKKHRQQTEADDVRQKKNTNDQKVAHLQKIQFKDYYQPQEYVQNPKYTSVQQKNAELKRNIREKFGLDPQFVDINTTKMADPTLKWVDQQRTSSLVVEKRKEDMKDLLKFDQKFYTFINGQRRVEERENCMARLTFKGLDTVTMNKQVLKKKRTLEMIDDMTKKFGDQVLGVHGAELPKFQGDQNDQFYWTLQKNYNKSPKIQSKDLYWQNNKYYAKNDEMKLADTTGLIGPNDPFKENRVKKIHVYDIPQKPTQINFWKQSDQIGDPDFQKNWNPTFKWSQTEKNYKCDGQDRVNRTFDKIVSHAQQDEASRYKSARIAEDLINKKSPRNLQKDNSNQNIYRNEGNNSQIHKTQTDNQISKIIKPGNIQQQKLQTIQDSNNNSVDNNQNQHISIVQQSSPLNIQKQNQQKQVDNIFNQSQGKGRSLLLQRMANISVTEKKLQGIQLNSSLGSTMAGTGQLPINMQTIGESSFRGSPMYSSPFKETTSRAMLTGVGFLAK